MKPDWAKLLKENKDSASVVIADDDLKVKERVDAKNGSMGTSTPCVLPQKLEDNKGLSEKLD